MSKWLKDVCPDQPVSAVACAAVASRLGEVWDRCRPAAEAASEDIEYVHQLRVSARRAAAALDVFDDLLPGRRARKMRRWLRRIRRAAGAARDLDVFARRVATLERAAGGAGPLAAVLHRLKGMRRQAQVPIVKAFRKLSRQRFSRKAKALAARVRWRSQTPELSFGQMARELVQSKAASFLDALSGDLATHESLHLLRIAGKELRYSMELTAGAIAPEFRDELYPVIASIQDQLGQINDHAVAAERIRDWLDACRELELRSAYLHLLEHEESAYREAKERFLASWPSDRRRAFAQRFAAVIGDSPSVREPA